jgi:hypothetical protein
MSNFRRFLSRRWLLAFLGALALLFGLAMLHPYPRQSLFGPTIRGKPWCVWEADIRRRVNWQKHEASWFGIIHHWLGGKQDREDRFSETFNHPEMTPMVIALLGDADWGVRDRCMSAIICFPAVRDRSALPALRKQHAEDDQAYLRLKAGHAIVRIEKDTEVLQWLIKQLDHADPEMRVMSIRELGLGGRGLADALPEFYPHIVARAQDANQEVRGNVMMAMPQFGKKGVPVLINGLKDADDSVRYTAVTAAMNMGPDAKEAFSALEACLRDSHSEIRNQADSAMECIDPERYKKLIAKTK